MKVSQIILTFVRSMGNPSTSDIEDYCFNFGFNIHQVDAGIGDIRSINSLKIVSTINNSRCEHRFRV